MVAELPEVNNKDGAFRARHARMANLSERITAMAKSEQPSDAKLVLTNNEPLHDLGAPRARFRVTWQKQNGDVFESEVDAHNMADAAWRVANAVYDTFHPSGRQLLDVTRLR